MDDYEEAIEKLKKKSWLKNLVRQRKLKASEERLANRLGYMGTAFMMMSPHLLPDQIGIVTYIICRYIGQYLKCL